MISELPVRIAQVARQIARLEYQIAHLKESISASEVETLARVLASEGEGDGSGRGSVPQAACELELHRDASWRRSMGALRVKILQRRLASADLERLCGTFRVALIDYEAVSLGRRDAARPRAPSEGKLSASRHS